MITKTTTKPVVKKTPALKDNPTNLVAFYDRYYSIGSNTKPSAWFGQSYYECMDLHDAEFVQQALVILRRLARNRQHVHVNDFWDAVDRAKRPLMRPTDMRMLGSAFQKAAKEGLIRPTDMAKKSDRFGSYWRTVWESRVFVPKATADALVITGSVLR